MEYQKLMGAIIDIKEIQMTGSLSLFFDNKVIGELRSAVIRQHSIR